MDGDFLDRALTSKQGNKFTSVLFYASWCSFSSRMHPKFEMLASMFPQVEHLAVEKSAALPRWDAKGFLLLILSFVNETCGIRTKMYSTWAIFCLRTL